jgi:hypothetical protein
LKQLAEAVVKLPADEPAFLADELLASLSEADLEKSWAEEAKFAPGVLCETVFPG